MKWKLFALLLLLLAFRYVHAQEQEGFTTADTIKINGLLKQSREKVNQDPAMAISLANEAKALSEKTGYQKGVATALKNRGIAYYFQGNPEEALLQWQQALTIFESAKDNIGVADLLGNIGIFYYNRGDDVKALDYYLQSLKIAESIGYKKGIVSALNNTGGIYYYKSITNDKALKYYLLALPLCEELGDKNSLGAISVNVGNIYLRKNDNQKALQYFNAALKAYETNPVNIPNVYNSLGALYLKQNNFSLAHKNYNLALGYGKRTNSRLNMVRSLVGEAKVFAAEKNYKEAIGIYKQAEKIATELNAALEFEELYEQLGNAYATTGDFGNAFKYQKLFTKIKDSLYNIEADKKVATLQFDFDLEKKQNEINLLTKDKSIQELQLNRQKTFKNALGIVLAMIVVIVFILYRGYRNKAKTNKILDKKNSEIENLLLNILPAEVAAELQLTGKATPRTHELASVMFTDFKGFTAIADNMSPQRLVEELNNCFIDFDNIIEKYGLEKIKTIGDSYMCAGGITTSDKTHVFNLVKASLEIQEYVYRENLRRKENDQALWEIRIGIHVGPLVAGVVGKKKYAFDIWGSTVNIASRMESSGMPGQVNISSTTYELIKEKYACVYRGKIYAKNIGEIDMYFIDHETENFDGFKNFEEAEKKEPLQQEPSNLLQ